MNIFSLFIGWPAIIGSLIAALIGINTGRSYLLGLGAVLISGFAWYLVGSPAPVFFVTGASLPILHLIAMFLVDREKKRSAALCLLPQVLITIYFAVAILLEGYR